MRVRIFEVLYSSLSDNDIAQEMETEINDWFASSPNISVTEILQTQTRTILTISIFYIGGE